MGKGCPRQTSHGVYYHPPHLANLTDLLKKELSSLRLSSYQHSILVGDVNLDLLKEDDDRCIDLLGITASFGLSQMVNNATRCTSSTSTLIDHVYVSSPAMLTSMSVCAPLGTSDHNCINLHTSLSKPRSRPTRRRVWLYKKANFDAMNEYLLERLEPASPLDADVNH